MKKWFIAALICSAMVMSASANLLSNSDFENGLTDWETGGGISVPNWNYHGGTNAVALGNWSDNFWGAAWQENITVTGSTTYDISAWYCQDTDFNDNGAAAYIEISWADGDNAYYDTWKNWNVNNTDNGNWNLTEFQAVAPANATQAKIVVGFEFPNEENVNGSTAYFDDLTMTEAVPEPVSAALIGIGIGFIYMLRRKITR